MYSLNSAQTYGWKVDLKVASYWRIEAVWDILRNSMLSPVSSAIITDQILKDYGVMPMGTHFSVLHYLQVQ